MQEYYIYMITNKQTGQIYIGMTDNPEKRWTKHCLIASGKRNEEKFYLQRSIAKYGVENFSFEVIETQSLLKEAQEAEQFYIAYFKGLGAGMLNLTNGGEGCWGRVMSRATRDKISKAKKGHTHFKSGEDCNFSKLKEDQVIEIRKLYDTGRYSHTELASMFSVGRTVIGDIVLNKLWKHLEPTIFYRKGRSKLTEDQKELVRQNIINKTFTVKKLCEQFNVKPHVIYDAVEKIKKEFNYKNLTQYKLKEHEVIEIRKLYATGQYTFKKIAEKYNVSRVTIGGIIKNYTWKHIENYAGLIRKGCSKLTKEQINCIVNNIATNEFTVDELSRMFKVHTTTIYNVIEKVQK